MGVARFGSFDSLKDAQGRSAVDADFDARKVLLTINIIRGNSELHMTQVEIILIIVISELDVC